MKIVTAQLNYTIGDMAGNANKIIDVIATQGNRADLIVFSELCITGYYPKDLLDREGFIDAQMLELDRIKKATEGMNSAIVVGVVMRNPMAGKKHLNALLFIEDGMVIYQYNKQLLPTYGVFDEARHFEPGGQVGAMTWRGKRVGFLICEDAWEDAGKPLYQKDPVAQLADCNCDVIVSINASPYNIYKRQSRAEVIKNIVKTCDCDVVYVNQVGGIDDLVFDGNSRIMRSNGYWISEAPEFEESVDFVDIRRQAPVDCRPDVSMKLMVKQLVMGLRDYCVKSGFKQVLVGSSGGIDSAVTLAICALAMGPENVVAVTMPSKYSSAGSVDDSVSLCAALGVELVESPIKETFEVEIQSYTEAFGEAPSGLAQENLQARIRGQRLMTLSNSTGAMVVSTGNKTELSVGYCTLYGDMAGGLSILADLYKGQVYDMANYLNEWEFRREVIPFAIITKEPSAELAEGQADTDSLPPYDQLDAYLQLILEGDLLNLDERLVLEGIAGEMPIEDKDRVRKMLDRNEYKRRQAPPLIRVNRRSFGADRQIPLTINYSTKRL
ncbi:MAG: NAD+ synthase [Cellvibrionaceae bacterium]|nr:NAD+ synthase [Cellvibrionaceae bacterium]|tara:strand:- start:17065 stop:18726 length:1662 start_codon:yes stop_codon:yes gene_type:complete